MFSRRDLVEVLRRAHAASPIEAVDVLVDDLRELLAAKSVVFLVTDVSGRALTTFAGTNANAARTLQNGDAVGLVPLAGTWYEQVLRSQQPLVVDGSTDAADGQRLIVPVADSGDALGVLDIHLSRPLDDDEPAELSAITGVLAHLLVASRRHSDLQDWVKETSPFTLAAEIQRRLLPGSYTCETAGFALAAWLEPANAVGGDTFDYSLDRDTLHLAITDAVGHDVTAALLASVTLGSLRNSRRRGADLARQAELANEALDAHSADGEFVTGQLGRVDLHTGELTLVNAGHPPPYLLRGGRVSELELAIDMPFGIEPGRPFTINRLQLEPGDRLLLITDGMVERGAETLDIEELLHLSGSAHPRELVYQLAEAVLFHTHGNLTDDATVMCLDWMPQRAGAPRRA